MEIRICEKGNMIHRQCENHGDIRGENDQST